MGDLWITIIPSIYVGYLTPFSLILMGYLVEKKSMAYRRYEEVL